MNPNNIITVEIHTSIIDAAKKMTYHNASFIVVCESCLPVGMVTYKDFVKKNIVIDNPKDTEIKKIMSTPLIHSRPEQSIWEVADMMYAREIKVIPVIDEYDRVLGAVGMVDIVKAFALHKN